MSQVICSL